jgi:hypothetical protein
MTTRAADTDRFYDLLDRLRHLYGGTRTLATSTARDGWPSHGLYFFYEPGETRSTGGPRVVRIGTHALTQTSRTTLWRRLAQHRGQVSGSNPGGGNHRGSVFRLHVGAALLRRDQAPAELLASWLSPRPDPQCRVAERAHERKVSDYIGAMPFLWLPVPTQPDGTSDRGYLERNSIALLSRSAGGLDRASSGWLGKHAVNPAVVRSELWNVSHVDDEYDARFLDLFAEHLPAGGAA